MARSNGDTHIPVEAHKHLDQRVNIPTGELAGFVADDEKAPKTLRWPRDPSLDPQLVWKGKNDTDGDDLEVPSVPVYIQEKIHPQALIENVRAEAKRGKPAPIADLFGDFDGVKFEEMVDFYHHQQHWSNRMILGDSLLVMSSLAEKERLKGKVQMVYLDPPYGIKFGSNWQVSTRKRDVKDGKVEDASRQPEQVKAFRDTWQLGIHSYLAYLRDRLVVARDLLTETGSCFVQIGDENVHLVRCVMDEVFGAENFCSLITVFKTSVQSSPTARTNVISSSADFILWYARNIQTVKYRPVYVDKSGGRSIDQVYTRIAFPDRDDVRWDGATDLPAGGRLYCLSDLTSQTAGETTIFEHVHEGRGFVPNKGGWKTHKTGLKRLDSARRVQVSGSSIRYVRFFDDFPVSPINNLWMDMGTGSFTEQKLYVVQTATKMIQRCLLMTTDPGDLVLDPTCGSGTTAYVAEQWGRRWITIDTSRVALALARTRLMAAKFPYYLLSDSQTASARRRN